VRIGFALPADACLTSCSKRFTGMAARDSEAYHGLSPTQYITYICMMLLLIQARRPLEGFVTAHEGGVSDTAKLQRCLCCNKYNVARTVALHLINSAVLRNTT
jgi:hypothetical protein